MVDDVHQYFNTHQIKDAILIGHSMGGKIAMQFAAEYPKFLSHFIIVDISPKYYQPHHDDILESLKRLKSKKLTSRHDAEEVLKEKIKQQGVRLFLLKNLKREDNNILSVKPNVDAFLKDRNEIGRAIPKSSIYKGATLFIKGENSPYIREKDSKLIDRHFPNNSLEIIKNAGHWVHAENPNEFFKQVMNFIK